LNLTVETTIRRPRDDVFAAFTDIPAAPQRITGIERVEPLSDGPFAPGYAWRETRTMLGKQVTERMEVTQADAPAHYRVESDSRGAHYVTDLTFEDAGPDRTRVRMTFDGRPQSLSARLMSLFGFAFARSFRKLLQKDLDDMRTSLEQATPVTSGRS
jgi:uncharacterized membrane protein